MLLPVASSACPFPWYALSNPNPSRVLARPCSRPPLIPITMAKARRYGLIPQLDIEQIVLEAQHRWLCPAEICEILRNHQKFHITTEPPIKPLSGSLFLFDRKVLRYFRKDGHIWRKKKDGKTVKEAHERLKDGSVDVLHCYYAHGEENEDFQRRSYWMLEEELMHIVLVHYLEVKGNRASYSHAREPEELAQVASMVSPVCSNSFTNQSFLPSWTAEAESTNSTKVSEYEDAESDNYQTSSRYNSFPELQEYDGSVKEMHISNPYVSFPYPNNQCNYQRLQETTPVSNFDSQEDFTNVIDETGLAISFGVSRTQSDLTALDEVLARYNTGSQSASFQASGGSSIQAANLDGNNKRDALTFGDLFVDDLSLKKKDAATGEGKPMCMLSDAEVGSLEIPNANVKSDRLLEGNINYALPLLELCNIEREEGLQKHDSFSRWMSKELGEVVDLQMSAGAGFDLSAFQSGTVEDFSIPNQERDTYLLSTSLSQDQLFSIIDFSPNWAYTGLKTKVLITGTFLRSKEDVCKCKWSCMFGEVEVPAEILADGTLRCHSPPHRPGRVLFYITCSNRLACSEVQEFEYRVSPLHNVETSDPYSRITKEIYLHIRFERLLSLGSNRYSESISSGGSTTSDICSKISSLMMEADDDWYNLLQLTCDIEISQEIVKDMLLEKLLKEKLHDWLLHNVAEAEDSKGLCVLDKEGQGVLHLAAALGYDWAIRPIITAGVSVNFRDVRGWTALHWAAFCGRERTIIALIAVGAAPGALTDPTPVFPSGQTPADLASENRHKGIAGFLAESSLTKHLTFLTLKEFECGDVADFPSVLGDNIVAERSIVQLADGDTQEGVSLKDSLNAVRNAAQAAARIYQAFRVQSFQRKQVVEYGDSKCRISEECALSLASVKHAKPGQHDMPVHAAAIRIQKKFRGWKGRKDFLIIRQRVVKIQAHFRGHQVRKHYKKIVWSVGIVEKAILRWRRKGSGLRGFRPERLLEGSTMQNQYSKQDDYDFLREGRKQTEAGLEKALARVKSMVQYPEARDQYRRLLTDVTELQQFKLMQDSKTSVSTEADHGDFMLELEGIWEDDTLVPAK